MEIVFRKLTQNNLNVFIELRINQLQEEGAEPTLDLICIMFMKLI